MTRRPLMLAVLLSLGGRATSAQLACQFSRSFVLSSLPSDSAATSPRLSIAGSAVYSFNLTPQNRAVAIDVTYRLSPAFTVAGGIVYCDPRLNISKRPIFGATATWMHRLATSWLFAAQAGASYIDLDLGGGFHQQETVLPAVVALGYSHQRLFGYAGGLVQYRQEAFPDGSSESKGEIGGLVGVRLKVAAPLAIGLAYNMVRFVDASGNAGRIDHGVVRLEYAFGRGSGS